MRGYHARYIILWAAHCHRCCFPGAARAQSHTCTPFTRQCAGDSGRYCDWPIGTGLGQGRPANFHPLRVWTCLPALSRGPGGRSRAVKGTRARIRWFRVPAFIRPGTVGWVWTLCCQAGSITAACCHYPGCNRIRDRRSGTRGRRRKRYSVWTARHHRRHIR